jgi:hypothetical protein
MGRTLAWYAVVVPRHHDKTKEVCLDLEYEPEKNEIELRQRLYEIVHPEKEMTENETYSMSHYKEMCKLWYSYKFEHKDKWCPKCCFYNNGIYSSGVYIDEYSVHHRYSNPIWESDWCVSQFYMGSHQTDLVRRFNRQSIFGTVDSTKIDVGKWKSVCFEETDRLTISKDHLYREITEEDIKHVYDEIERLGNPIRKSDMEAKEETLGVLEFLNTHVGREDVHLIMEDEY